MPLKSFHATAKLHIFGSRLEFTSYAIGEDFTKGILSPPFGGHPLDLSLPFLSLRSTFVSSSFSSLRKEVTANSS